MTRRSVSVVSKAAALLIQLAEYLTAASARSQSFPLDRSFVKDVEGGLSRLKQTYNAIKYDVGGGTTYSVVHQDGKLLISPAPKELDKKVLYLLLERDLHKELAEQWLKQANDLKDSLTWPFGRNLIELAEKSHDFHQKRYEEIKEKISGFLGQYVRDGIDELRKTLEDQVRKNLPNAHRAESGGLAAQSNDKDIHDCLRSGLEAKTVDRPNAELMVDLLSKGLPFVCSSYTHFPGGGEGYHATTVIGYRYNSEYETKLEFQVRDSNNLRSYLGLACYKMKYVCVTKSVYPCSPSQKLKLMPTLPRNYRTRGAADIFAIFY